MASKPFKLRFRWADAISRTEWITYRDAIRAVRSADIPFLLGGGFALATFTGYWRDTKDIDFYIKPKERSRVIQALTRAGFSDYFSKVPYDRKWIYRSVRSGVIVDIIWSMANQRAAVDELWFKGAGSVSIRDEKLRVIPMEELLWCKLYILQRDHCDWTDILNLIYSNGRDVNWNHLLWRLDHDAPLLRAALTLFTWICPGTACKLPAWLWNRLDLPKPPRTGPPVVHRRVRFLDSRAWFVARLPSHKTLEV